MTAHDDDRVIHLLRDAVPPVPDVADRVTAVRQRAGRQRVQLMTQVLGAAASVLLLVGVAAAVANPGASKPVPPAADPLRDLAATFAKQTSVAFEFRTTPVGPTGGYPSGIFEQGNGSPEESAKALTSHARGAVSIDGTGWLDGDISILGFFIGAEDEEFHLRLTRDAAYRSVTERDQAPAGKKWARSETGEDDDFPKPADIEKWLRVGTAFAEDVRFVRSTEVRGVQVAEYALHVPDRYTNGADVDITLFLDKDGLPRRLTTEVSMTKLFEMDGSGYFGGYPGSSPPPPPAPNVVRAELDLFDYNEPVHVDVPPAGEVIDEDTLMELTEQRMSEAHDRYTECMRAAGKDKRAQQRCADEFEQATGYPGGMFTVPEYHEDGCSTSAEPGVTGEIVKCVEPTFGGDATVGTGDGVLLHTLEPAPPSSVRPTPARPTAEPRPVTASPSPVS
jgi:hypothetical protein